MSAVQTSRKVRKTDRAYTRGLRARYRRWLAEEVERERVRSGRGGTDASMREDVVEDAAVSVH